MASQPTSPVPQVPAKHTHYVSIENGVIHPAMTYPSGYEDEHPTEWRPATVSEVKKYKAGSESTVTVQPVQLSDVENVTPSTIKLADEDPVLPEIVNPAAPAAPAAAVVPPAAPTPAPAFGGTKSE